MAIKKRLISKGLKKYFVFSQSILSWWILWCFGFVCLIRIESGAPRFGLLHKTNLDLQEEGFAVDITHFDTGMYWPLSSILLAIIVWITYFLFSFSTGYIHILTFICLLVYLSVLLYSSCLTLPFSQICFLLPAKKTPLSLYLPLFMFNPSFVWSQGQYMTLFFSLGLFH